MGNKLRLKWKTILLIIFLLVFLAIVLKVVFFKKEIFFDTEPVVKGKIEKNISANGPLNPVFTVNVGTQISGIINKIYVDFNDQVNKNQLLAEIDPSLLEAKISQSIANLESANAILKASKSKYLRQMQLETKGYISKGALEDSEKEYKKARATVVKAEAELEKEKRNMQFSKIVSPIDGVVIQREIDVGQTVAASFQTPTLFKIARNLSEMQIELLVSEADIGNIKKGQVVKFQVDAFQRRNFNGIVKLVRLEPEIEQNVVSYKVIVDVENSDGVLLPGMTAQADIKVISKDDVLKIPLQSLRFTPPSEIEFFETPTTSSKTKTSLLSDKNTEDVFILNEGKLLKNNVSLGISDGKYIEILSGLKSGDKVVLRTKKTNEKKSNTGFRFKFR